MAKTLVETLFGPGGPPWGTTFEDLEERVVQLGQTVSREALRLALQKQAASPVPTEKQLCLGCQQPPQPGAPEPRILATLKKVVFAGTRCGSFARGAEALRELAEVEVPVKQAERRTQQIGTERCVERDTAAAYEALPLVERKKAPPDGVAPPIAVVQMDGGRIQIRDHGPPEQPNAPAAAVTTPEKKKGEHWREDKVGLLASMTSTPDAGDPCPQLPTHYVDPARIPRLAQEIKSKSEVTGREELGDTVAPAGTGSEPATVGRYEPPELVVRSVVSTKQGVEVFGGLLAAWARGFYGSERRVFLGDGSNANWGVWERHFSSFTPVVDFIHALAYVYGAAMAGGPFAEGWSRYVL